MTNTIDALISPGHSNNYTNSAVEIMPDSVIVIFTFRCRIFTATCMKISIAHSLEHLVRVL